MAKGKTLNAERYQAPLEKEITDEVRELFGDSNWIFLHDGAPAHRAASTRDWLQENGITASNDFPPNSPDLNIIENIWHTMKHRLYARRIYYDSTGLERALRRVWNGIQVQEIRVLIDSMPKRIQECIGQQGGHTSYKISIYVSSHRIQIK